LVAKAFDVAGNSAQASATVNFKNAVVGPADTVAPVVTMKPVTTSKSSIVLGATATDSSGVVSMTLFVDGVSKARTTTGSISLNLNVRKLSAGTHIVRVEARDAAGNVGTSESQFTK
jgi:hypothetical protein